MIEENVRLKHFGPLGLSCTLRIPQGSGPFHLVIAAPGFLGFKDWGFFPYLGQRLCQAGLASLCFSHSLCGIGENPLEITDLESFSKNSTTQELKDWDLILDSILSGRIPYAERLRLNALGIVGHSRGGSYGILMANRFSQIQSLVTWGAIQTFHRYGPENQRRWRETGNFEIAINASGKVLQLPIHVLDALEQNSGRLDVLQAMRSLNIPVLLLHGREDKRVPLSEGQKLWQCANPHLSRFHILQSAGHSFRTQHPLSAPSEPLREAISETVRYFQTTLHR